MKYTGERFMLDNDGKEIEAEHLHRYRIIASQLQGMNVLDAGCGSGYGSNILARNCSKVTAIDISNETIKWCNEKYGEIKNLEFVQGSLSNLPFLDNTFDCIVNLEVIEHVEKDIQEEFLKEAKRVLKPNGFIIMSTPNKRIYTDESNYKNPYHVCEFYPDEFRRFLKKEFTNVQMYNQELFMVSSIFDESRNSSTIKLIKDKEIEQEEKYMIAICSNSNQELIINIDSIYKYDNVKNNMISTLYSENRDMPGIYSNNSKIIEPLYIDYYGNFEIEFDISKFTDAQSFRFDPIENEFCICRIDEVKVDGKLCEVLPINAFQYYKNGFVFLNIDPQFKIKGEFLGEIITIKGYCKVLNSLEINKFTNELYKQISDDGKEIVIRQIYNLLNEQSNIMYNYIEEQKLQPKLGSQTYKEDMNMFKQELDDIKKEFEEYKMKTDKESAVIEKLSSDIKKELDYRNKSLYRKLKQKVLSWL